MGTIMMQDFLDTALLAAQAAAGVIGHYYEAGVKVELKQDRSPVTVADVEAEKVIKEVIQRVFPAHGFYGEETGRENSDADYVWLIDPIDGTKSFIRQYPFFSTQIALLHRGELVLGVSNAPLFGECAYAVQGGGAFLNARRVCVSGIDTISEATLSFGNVTALAASERWARLSGLVQRVNRVRGYGDFYHYHLLASGRIEVVLESDLSILDIAALTVIIREAGGTVSDLDGQSIGLNTRSILAANSAAMHAAVLRQLTC